MNPKIREALKKPAPYGPDINLEDYGLEEPRVEEGLTSVSTGVNGAARRLGLQEISRISYLQVNETAFFRFMESALRKYGVEVMPLKLAMEKNELAKRLAWRLVKPHTDKYTAAAFLHGGELGYSIYVPPKTSVPLPIYTCLAITSEKRVQFAHNVVYVGEGSEAHIVTGCAIPHGVSRGVHIGISEFYIARNAKLTFSMIHAWFKGLHVRPRTAVKVEEGGEYVSYYVIYSPVASLQTFPTAHLAQGGKTYMASIVAASGEGEYDVGARSVLGGRGSSAEIVSRIIARDSARVYARAEISSNNPDTKGHIECLGLLLSEDAAISSIPVISSSKPRAMLSHEAAIGLIAQEEIEYLMSKGFKEDEARAIIIRGFMDVRAPGIPQSVRAEIGRILDMVSKHAVG